MRLRNSGREAFGETPLNFCGKPGCFGVALRYVESRHEIPLFEPDVAPFGDKQRVVTRIRIIPKQLTHLRS